MSPGSAHIKVLNSLLFIGDARKKNLPTIDGEGAYWFTPSCVAVSCLPDCDGSTSVTMGTAQEVKSGGKLLLDRHLNTPSHNIIVETVLAEIVLEQRVTSDITRIRIWTNGSRDTDEVTIGLG